MHGVLLQDSVRVAVGSSFSRLDASADAPTRSHERGDEGAARKHLSYGHRQVANGRSLDDEGRAAEGERGVRDIRVLVHRHIYELHLGECRADATARFEAIDDRHRDVQDDDVRLQALCSGNERSSISSGADDVVFVGEQRNEHLEHLGLVFRNQDAHSQGGKTFQHGTGEDGRAAQVYYGTLAPDSNFATRFLLAASRLAWTMSRDAEGPRP